MSLLIATDNNFQNEVLNSPIPVLVDFWGEWCGPCKAIAPIIEEIAQDYKGRVKVAKLDIESNPDVVMNFGIRSFPALLLFIDGFVVDSFIGLVKKSILVDKIESYL
jgi:thioredoxin 1